MTVMSPLPAYGPSGGDGRPSGISYVVLETVGVDHAAE
jgi:hypothetical protein